jgi:hypothetical protein
MVAEYMFESFPDQGASNQLVYGAYWMVTSLILVVYIF